MKVKDFNQMESYLTRPDTKTPEQNATIKAKQDSEDAKRRASKRKEYGLSDMTDHVIDTLNKFEDGPDIVKEVIRNSPVPVKGYVGGTTPNDTEPTKAERIAAQKQFEKIAVQPDSRGYFKKLVAADEKEFKDKRNLKDDPRGVAFNPTTKLFTNKDRTVAFKSYDEADTWNKAINVKTKYYQDEATPEQVGAYAERMERHRQITGSDGRYDKAIIKKKKIIPSKTTASPIQLSFNYNPKQTFVPPRDTRSLQEIIRDGADQRLRQEQEAYDKQFGTSGIARLKRPK